MLTMVVGRLTSSLNRFVPVTTVRDCLVAYATAPNTFASQTVTGSNN